MEADLSPREYLKARHPDRFSDTVAASKPVLDRSMLEYFLHTVTSRKQEVEFERFALALVQREICPNLIPQSGPTGGGDSKVDSETYPVADSLSLIWRTGVGREAAAERWAFAFSAKRAWQAKLKSDIAKLATTGRGYRKAFFVSSQYISDKTRAKVEDALSVEHGIDVRVLDRTWILDTVFRHRYEDIAITELELEIASRDDTRKGPNDLTREAELEELERSIEKWAQRDRLGYQAVEDTIRAAVIAARLERPRPAVDGLFDRAVRVAAKNGTPHQQLEAAYQRAWTTFWWYEDYEAFCALYEPVAQLAHGTQNVHEVGSVVNLWFLLNSAVSIGGMAPDEIQYSARTTALAQELDRLAACRDRPSTALYARTMRLHMQLLVHLRDEQSPEPVLAELRDILMRCEGLVGYPLQPMVEILSQWGDALGSSAAYDDLFDTMTDIASAREEEVFTARMLLRRGEQHLGANRPYDAINLLGRAFPRLCKDESREDAIKAMYLCGLAYERVDLLWAARSVLLGAASLATDEFLSHGETGPLQALCYSRLKWAELRLGRLPQALAWHQVDLTVRAILLDQGWEEDVVDEGELQFDVTLGALLLRTRPDEIPLLSSLPDVLRSLDLYFSQTAALYTLGHEELIDETFRQEMAADNDLRQVFARWYGVVGPDDIPAEPYLYGGETAVLRSRIMGCAVQVVADAASPTIELAETIIGALEAVLATGFTHNLLVLEPKLSLRIRLGESGQTPFTFSMSDQADSPHVDVTCGTLDDLTLSDNGQEVLTTELVHLLADIMATILAIDDPERCLAGLLRGELALQRSVCLAGGLIAVGQVLGQNARTRLCDWYTDSCTHYPVTRTEPIYAGSDKEQQPDAATSGSSGERPSASAGAPLDSRHVRHSQVRVVSLIRCSLWEKAQWFGTAFATAAGGGAPPVLAPMFRDKQAAQTIFAQWRRDLGCRDDEGKLRISIVRGIDASQPYAYAVIIGSSLGQPASASPQPLPQLMSRVSTMAPDSHANLERFLDALQAHGSYHVAPAVMDDQGEPALLPDCSITKSELCLKEAWQIGRDDIDAVAIDPDVEPVIPCEQVDPPVLGLLEWLRTRSQPTPPAMVDE